MICKEYQIERTEFCRKINQVIVPFESFTSRENSFFLMSTNDTEVLMLLVNFMDKCLQREMLKVYLSLSLDPVSTNVQRSFICVSCKCHFMSSVMVLC